MSTPLYASGEEPQVGDRVRRTAEGSYGVPGEVIHIYDTIDAIEVRWRGRYGNNEVIPRFHGLRFTTILPSRLRLVARPINT